MAGGWGSRTVRIETAAGQLFTLLENLQPLGFSEVGLHHQKFQLLPNVTRVARTETNSPNWNTLGQRTQIWSIVRAGLFLIKLFWSVDKSGTKNCRKFRPGEKGVLNTVENQKVNFQFCEVRERERELLPGCVAVETKLFQVNQGLNWLCARS